MLPSWNKFSGWKVLEFFLNSSQKIHINGLAKKLKISPATARAYMSEYEKEGLLEKEATANVICYRLKETPLAMELKKALIIRRLAPFIAEFMHENPHTTTLALYGSHAKGAYDGKSDIDLLAISQEKKICIGTLKKIEEKTGKEAKAQVFTMAGWKNMLRKNDNFALAVIRNNILLAGEPL